MVLSVTVGPARSFARSFSCRAIDLRSVVFCDGLPFTVCVSCRGLVVVPAGKFHVTGRQVLVYQRVTGAIESD